MISDKYIYILLGELIILLQYSRSKIGSIITAKMGHIVDNIFIKIVTC